MTSSRRRPTLGVLAILVGIATSGCGSTWVVVPHPVSQYSATDTVYGIRNGDRVRVTFHYDTIMRVDTVLRVDTAWVNGTRTIVRRDTVLRVDTVRTWARDTVVRTRTVVRTVRAPGRRLLFLPPGHYPPDGQCRIWVHGVPPGQQAKPAACDALGDIPAGAFILFAGDAWDFDYDWIAEAGLNPGAVPTQIVALQRAKPGRPAAGSRGRRP